MDDRIDRIERFRSEAAALQVKTGGAGRDRVLQIAGAVAMAVGVGAGLLAYQASLAADDQRDIQSSQILAVAMLGLVVAGAAVFLRYSLGRFLRFWLLRQLYEGQAHLDELVAALGVTDARQTPSGAGASAPSPAAAASPAGRSRTPE
jgi:hypothetical protein